MRPWEDYSNCIVEFARSRVLPRLRQEQAELRRRRARAATPATRQEPDPLFDKIFRGYVEILDTYEVLQDIEVYLRRFPFPSTRIATNRYLRYHIQVHLHEIYILRERLMAYTKTLQRLYRGSPNGQAVAAAMKEARDLAGRRLHGVVMTRGAHVHQQRFTDKQLDDLTGTELVAAHSDDPLFRNVLAWQHRDARKRLLEKVRKNNAEIGDLLDSYAALLRAVVFDERGKLVDPNPRGA